MSGKVGGLNHHSFGKINVSNDLQIIGNGTTKGMAIQSFEFFGPPGCEDLDTEKSETLGPEIVNVQAAQYARGEDIDEPDSPQRPIEPLSDDDDEEMDPVLMANLKNAAAMTQQQESGSSRRSAVSFSFDPTKN